MTMDHPHIERFGSIPGMGTFGRLKIGDDFKCLTVEDEWKDNQRNISCIPADTEGYPLEWGRFHRGEYDCYEVNEVENRSFIKIHIANIADNVQGCIGLGRAYGWVNGKWAVIESTNTLLRFHQAMEGAEKRLTISWRRLYP